MMVVELKQKVGCQWNEVGEIREALKDNGIMVLPLYVLLPARA